MVEQSLFNNLAIALKLSFSFSLVSMSIRDSRVKCFCLIINTSFLLGGNSHIYIKILAEHSERLNSIIERRKVCKFKFHRGVEFKFAIKLYNFFGRKIQKSVDKEEFIY